jgi:hypothetical protein
MTATLAAQNRSRPLPWMIQACVIQAGVIACALVSILPSHAQNRPIQLNRCLVVTAPFEQSPDGGGRDSVQCCQQERVRHPPYKAGIRPPTCCEVARDGRQTCYRFRTVCRRGPCSK